MGALAIQKGGRNYPSSYFLIMVSECNSAYITLNSPGTKAKHIREGRNYEYKTIQNTSSNDIDNFSIRLRRSTNKIKK